VQHGPCAEQSSVRADSEKCLAPIGLALRSAEPRQSRKVPGTDHQLMSLAQSSRVDRRPVASPSACSSGRRRAAGKLPCPLPVWGFVGIPQNRPKRND
jgi:hypothetical protein